MNESNDKFVIQCSDDENYENNESNYRFVSGKKVWEPNGQQIGSLYRQLEAKGFIELRWQCPGRRSPSVHNINLSDRQKIESTDNETNLLDKSSDLLNEFDFETEFSAESQVPNIATKSGPPKRQRQTGLRKSQTNLTKVMADIKKYQFIDQQTKRLSLHTTLQTSLPSTPTLTTQSTAEMTSQVDSNQTVTNFSQSLTNVSQTMVNTSLSSVNTSYSSANTFQTSLNTSQSTFSLRNDSPTDILP